MLATAHGSTLLGLVAHPVRIEVQAARGVPSFELIGQAEGAVRESRVRVKSALFHVGVDLSEYRVVANLAPADLRKRGSAFDLALAAATLVALGRIPQRAIDDVLVLGELSLDGRVQPLRGLVAHLLGAKTRGVPRAVVPRDNEEEAGLVDGIAVESVATLAELVAALRGEASLGRVPARTFSSDPRGTRDDLADVRGQASARRALEVAAAGGHNLLFLGPPGAGKTMLARRLPGILPPLTREEALDVAAIHGVAGIDVVDVTGRRPFRAPHHTASEVALVGGGELARPGEVSLAHDGVLFLDELAEFRRSTLEALRQPLEDGVVTVARAQMRSTFPARPLVVAATNPCPCGHRGDGTTRCQCRADKIREYRARLSGPLLDRIDVHVSLAPVDVLALQAPSDAEPSAVVRARVERARAVQRSRQARGCTSAALNAHLAPHDVDRVCALDEAGRGVLRAAARQLGLSARAYGKVLRVARTIADLAGDERITPAHLGEAVGGRLLDRITPGSSLHAA